MLPCRPFHPFAEACRSTDHMHTEAIAIAVFNITERVYLQFLLATISAVLLLTPDIDSIVMSAPS